MTIDLGAPPGIDKLPVRIRDYIAQLSQERDRAIERAENAALKVRAENAGSKIFIENGYLDVDRVPINKYAEVSFTLGGGSLRDGLTTARVVTRNDLDWIELSADMPLLTLGVASNVHRVRPVTPSWGP